MLNVLKYLFCILSVILLVILQHDWLSARGTATIIHRVIIAALSNHLAFILIIGGGGC